MSEPLVSAPLLALKVDVDTLRGTLEGVPALLRCLQTHHAGATFLFSLGPDHTGRALRRVFRPGFLRKVSRTSVVSHYGLRTLLYGTLLPGPDIGRRGAAVMREVAAQGFETGIHTWDHIAWQDQVARRDAAWTEQALHRAAQRYAEIFGQAAQVHGAAGWQMNGHAYRWQVQQGLAYASDTRGQGPFLPVVDGRTLAVPQLPTTLPTLDELLGREGWNESNVHQALLKLTKIREGAPTRHHVFTLHAELEGQKLLPVLQRLLQGWNAQGYRLVALADLAATLDPAQLPAHPVVWGEVAGRSGELMLQGEP